MALVALTDDELDIVLAAARPLPIRERDKFLQDVAVALANVVEVGPGVVYRVVAQVQRAYFDPPNFQHAAHASKYR